MELILRKTNDLKEWDNKSKKITLKELLIEKKLPPGDNIAIVVPENYNIFDFESGGVYINEFYKEVVLKYLKDYTNLQVLTPKGVMILVKGNYRETTALLSPLGFSFKILSPNEHFVIKEKNNKKRKFRGKPHYPSGKKLRLETGKNLNSIKPERLKILKTIGKGDKNIDFNAFFVELLYCEFGFIHPFKIERVLRIISKIGNFNFIKGKIYDTIYDIKTNEKAALDKDLPFKLIRGKRVYNIQGYAQTDIRKLAKVALTRFENRLYTYQDQLYIILDNGRGLANQQIQITILKNWIWEAYEERIHKDTAIRLIDELTMSAKRKTALNEPVYGIKNKSLVINSRGKVVPIDIEKHMLVGNINREITETDSDYCEEKEIKALEEVLDYIKDRVGLKDLELMLKNIWNICIPSKKAKKMVLLYGEANTGKSTFIEFMKNFVGPSEVYMCSINSLLTDKFSKSGLIFKVLAYDDDIGGFFDKHNVGELKTLASSDTLNVEIKYHPAYNEIITTKIGMLCNKIPALREEEGVAVRFDIFEFPELEKTTTEFLGNFKEIHYNALFRYLLEKKYTIDQIASISYNKAKLQFFLCTNPVFRFLSENNPEDWDYVKYLTGCNTNGYRSKKYHNFLEDKNRWIKIDMKFNN